MHIYIQDIYATHASLPEKKNHKTKVPKPYNYIRYEIFRQNFMKYDVQS